MWRNGLGGGGVVIGDERLKCFVGPCIGEGKASSCFLPPVATA